MALLSRYTVREVASHMLAILVVVLAVFLLGKASDLLADAVEGSLPGDTVFVLLGLRTLMALPSLLPVTLYLGVLFGLGRLYQDLEMTALQACGVPERRIHWIVAQFAFVFALLVASLTFSVRPWAAKRFDAVKKQAIASAGLADISPGRFYSMDNGAEQVVFAGSRSPDDPLYVEDVFVQRRRGNKISILVAKRAIESHDEAAGFRFLTLLDGHRYDLDRTGLNEEITGYEQLVLRSPLTNSSADDDPGQWNSALQLSRSADPRDQSELQWRFAMPISAFLLALLAIPLGRIRPREGKYARFGAAIMLYVGYRQLLGAAKAWVADGALGVFPGLWAVHGLCLLLVVLLFSGERWTSRRAGLAG